jgi:mRNA interferase MazF
VVIPTYTPRAGDLVWLDFTPQAGREQAGRRPAIVLTPAAYNAKSGLAIVCPITTHEKGYPFEVSLPKTGPISGVILADHVKSLDWRERRAERAGAVPQRILEGVRDRLATLLGFGS